MTISSTGPRFSYTGNGVTTAFSFPRQFFADADLDVYLVDQSTGVATLQVLATHYTVSGAGSPSGGTVTMLTAPPAGKTLLIMRDTPLTQGLDLDNVTALPMTSLEAALDRAMMVVDELAAKVGRAIMYPLTGLAAFDFTFPAPVANLVLGVNATGNGLTLRSPQVWSTGAGVPAGAAGSVGDFYLDTTTGDVYQKTGVSTWLLQTNMRGPQGVPGSMTGPGGSVAGNLPTFASTSGTLLQDSGVSMAALLGYRGIVSSASTVTLTATDPRSIGVTGSSNQTIVLPVVSTLTLGTEFYFVNASTGTLTIQSSGLNTVLSIPQFCAAKVTSNAITGTGAAVWHAVYEGSTVSTGFGSLVFHNSATHNRIRFNSANAVTAGTNAQGQGALTETVNMITTAANNPSGVTLPSPSSTSTTSTWVTVINRGANPVNVYPASGHQIDALGANNPILLPVGGVLTFFSIGTTQWCSSNTGNFLTDASGNVSIGGASQAGLSGQVEAFQVLGASGPTATIAPKRYTADTFGANIRGYKSRGASVGTNTVIVSGDDLLQITGLGYDGSAYSQAAQIILSTEGTISSGVIPGVINFKTADAAGAMTSRLRIDSGGNVLSIGAGGLGYGPGAGGAVTQITSRATGVTLNKASGDITLFTAAGSTTATTFTVTNSLVAATDTIVAVQKSGTNLYNIIVTAVGAGSFNVTFYTTGGTASDTPVFHFNVMKGSNT